MRVLSWCCCHEAEHREDWNRIHRRHGCPELQCPEERVVSRACCPCCTSPAHFPKKCYTSPGRFSCGRCLERSLHLVCCLRVSLRALTPLQLPTLLASSLLLPRSWFDGMTVALVAIPAADDGGVLAAEEAGLCPRGGVGPFAAHSGPAHPHTGHSELLGAAQPTPSPPLAPPHLCRLPADSAACWSNKQPRNVRQACMAAALHSDCLPTWSVRLPPSAWSLRRGGRGRGQVAVTVSELGVGRGAVLENVSTLGALLAGGRCKPLASPLQAPSASSFCRLVTRLARPRRSAGSRAAYPKP